MDTLPVEPPDASGFEVRLSVVEKAVVDLRHDLQVLGVRVDAGFQATHDYIDVSISNLRTEFVQQLHELEKSLVEKMDAEKVERRCELNEKIAQSQEACLEAVQELDQKLGQLNEKVDQFKSGLEEKIDRTRKELEEKIDKTRKELEEKIDRTRKELEEKIDRTRIGLEEKIDKLESRLDKRLQFYARVYLATTVPMVLAMVSLAATVAGRVLLWW